MIQEERFSGKRGLQGCLVGLVFMVVVPLSISLVLNRWLGPISHETERVVFLVSLLVAVCLGGYVAARLGKNTGWTNSLMVGLIAELVVFSRVLMGRPDQSLFDPLFDIMNDPGAHWRVLVELALTIPVAILGGVIWQKTGGVQSAAKRQSEVVNKAERAEE
jgi:putative membrane protein (TIGR04086 family)